MSTFHRFADLPYDVRMLVWQWYAVPAPNEPSRIVHINHWRPCWSSTPAPAIMHVCHDARALGLQLYHPSFACCTGQRQNLDPQIPHTCRLPIWINFDTDTVKMSMHFFHEKRHMSEFDLIQRLQLTCDDDDANYFLEYALGPFDLPRLKSLDMVHDGDMDTWYGQIYNPSSHHGWGCPPSIVRVIGNGGTEILNFERDKNWWMRENGYDLYVEDEWDSDDNWKREGNHRV